MDTRRRWLVGSLLAVDVVIAGTLILLGGGGDEGQVRTEENPTPTTVAGNQAMPPISARPRATTSTTTTAPPTTTTTGPPTTTTTTAPPPARPVARPAAPGDIDGDGVADRVSTERIGYGPNGDDEWMLTAELSALGTRRLPFLVGASGQVGDGWGVTDADADGFGDIFLRSYEGEYSVRLSVVRLVDDELVEARGPTGQRLLLSVGGGVEAEPATGFACRDERPDLPGRELVVMTGGPSGLAFAGDARIHRWVDDHVELVETRPMTGTHDEFARIDCDGVRRPA
ncbi:MAG: hypothetical protein ACRD0U_20225 [Acidimicrobiales bacterium]